MIENRLLAFPTVIGSDNGDFLLLFSHSLDLLHPPLKAWGWMRLGSTYSQYILRVCVSESYDLLIISLTRIYIYSDLMLVGDLAS